MPPLEFPSLGNGSTSRIPDAKQCPPVEFPSWKIASPLKFPWEEKRWPLMNFHRWGMFPLWNFQWKMVPPLEFPSSGNGVLLEFPSLGNGAPVVNNNGKWWTLWNFRCKTVTPLEFPSLGNGATSRISDAKHCALLEFASLGK